VNRYNGLVIVITVYLNTQRKQSVSLCNESVIVAMIYETNNDSVNRYNVSAQSDTAVILSKSL
jgi:hypothetical protein